METYIFILDKFSALTIELIICVFSIIGIIASICGLSDIPFEIDKKVFKKIFTINIYLLIFILLISIILITLRKLRLINHTFNFFSYVLSIILIIISIVGFLKNVFIDTFIINNMNYYDAKAKKNNSEKLSKKQWVNTVLIIITLLVLYFLFIFLGLSDYLRISLKIDDSYYKFQLAIEEEMRTKKEIENKLKNIKQIPKENHNINIIKDNNNANNQMFNSDNDLKRELGKNEEKK